jgi:hypothetical protein
MTWRMGEHAVVLGQVQDVHAFGSGSRCRRRQTRRARRRGPYFLQVALELFEQAVGRGHGDDGHVLVHQGQRAVLELAGGVGFGVDVGDFLELEGAFEGDG